MTVSIQRSGSVSPIKDCEPLQKFLNASMFAWSGYIDGKLACMWGLIPPTLLSSQAYLWLHTNELIDEHRFVFVRHSQLVVENMLKEYETIVGHVLKDNARARRWLKWLGAEFGKPDGRKIPFVIRKKVDG